MGFLWPRSFILSSSLFPYSIAAVCSLWRHAISLIPECWTRFVIVIDSRPAITPSAILSQLSWSRDLSLDVVITRREFTHPADRQHERTQVTSIMNTFINPYVHRIQVLCFDVMFSSSLPPFHNGFRGTASILEELRLECMEDNGSSADWESFVSTERQFPALANLFIDGRSYYNACKRYPHFADELTGLWGLAISHYTPLPGESFPASDFLRPITTINDLQYLGMTDLVLDPSSLPLPTSIVLPTLKELKLEDIHNPHSLPEILHLVDAYDITFTYYPTGDPGPFHAEGRLTLEDIDADQDLVPLLRNWGGESLTVIGCPSFNDTVLHMMTPHEDGTPHCARYLSHLAIVDCPDFSVTALRLFVSVKSSFADDPIRSLRISGRAPLVAEEDYLWLSKKTSFDYKPSEVI